jgi:membrane protein
MRIPFVKTLWKAGMLWSEDRASYLGAALAYHALFSIAPLLIIAIASIGLFYGEGAMKVKVLELARQQIGQEGSQALGEMLEHVWRPTTTLWASIVGPIILFFTASNFFLQLGTALEMIWNIKPTANRHWLYGMIKNYVMAFLMVLISGSFLIALMIADGMMTYFINLMRQYEIGNPGAWSSSYYFLSIILVAGMFLFTFRILSHGKIPYACLWEGALVASVLFLLGRLFFSWYVASMGKALTTAFGAASSVVIFLIWVYYSAQILFYGAEVVKVRLQARRGNGGNGVPKGALS